MLFPINTVIERIAGPEGLRGFAVRSARNIAAGRESWSGAAWVSLATVLSNASVLAVSLLIVRLLGAEGYGRYGLIQSTVLLFSALAASSLGSMASSYVAQFRPASAERASRAASAAYLAALLLGAACIAAALILPAPVLVSFLQDPLAVGPLRLAAALVAAHSVFSVQTGVLLGIGRYKSSSQLQITRGALQLLAIPAGAVLAGLNGAIAGLLAASLLACLAAHFAVAAACRASGMMPFSRPGKAEAGLLWEYSLPAMAGASLVVPVQWLLAAMLAASDGGFLQAGLFFAASQWRSGVAMLPNSLTQYALPLLSARLGSGDSSGWKRTLNIQLAAATVLGLVCSLPLLLLLPWIVRIYGPSFHAASPLFAISILTGILVGANNMIGVAIASARRLWSGFALNLIWALAVLLPLWTGLLPITAMGVITAVAAAYVLHSVLQAAFILPTARTSPQRTAALQARAGAP